VFGFLVGFLPFVVAVLMARRLARRGTPGLTSLNADQRPAAVKRLSIAPGPPAVIAPVDPVDDTDVREAIPAWTALDDLQLDRLLREASS
jgi:hypothetical protein